MGRLRILLVVSGLAAVLVPAAGAEPRAKAYAPKAVALVRSYLRDLQTGDVASACRLFSVPSVCAAGANVRIGRFAVAAAEPTVDGVEVPARIDSQDALFQLVATNGRYRIVDVVADPALAA